MDKWRLRLVKEAFSLIMLVAMLSYDIIPLMFSYAEQATSLIKFPYKQLSDIYFFMIMHQVIDLIVEVPFSWVSTFVVEEKHGFNKTSIGTFVGDLVKTSILTAVFMPFIMFLITQLVQIGSENFVNYAWLGTNAIILGAQLVYPNFIAPLYNEFTQLGNLTKQQKKDMDEGRLNEMEVF